ncbi:MAG TPA: nucleotide exchange factor GrpE [Streptosporangiaceae bacterium]|nr:nucleotide exchange factor GrpE [Streptosporangiaceae bacterium]
MTGYDEVAEQAMPELVDVEPAVDVTEALDRVNAGQDELFEALRHLHDEFERLAANVTPLLTTQYRSTEQRIRVLETRLRNRQERPLIVQIANLLSDVRRLKSGDDVKTHVEEALMHALSSVGYQEMGSAGDQFDPAYHEPLSGSTGQSGVVTRVFSRGLSCYGDVILKAKVEVEPVTQTREEQEDSQDD